MADVRPPEDRGQLLLVTGLVLAVSFVGLALLLNTAIFAENLATRQTGGDGAAVMATSVATDGAVAASIFHVDRSNRDGLTRAELRDELASDTGNWSTAAGRQLSVDGVSGSVELLGTTNGTRIVHENGTRAWTDADGDGNWTLYSGVDAGAHRWFTLNVSRADLPTMSLDDDVPTVMDHSFTVEVTSDTFSDTWRLHLFRATGTENVHVLVETPSGTLRDAGGTYADHVHRACVARGETVDVQVWEGTVEHTPCEALAFAGELEGDVTVRFENATDGGGNPRVGGTYDVLVADTAVSDAPYNDASANDDSPYSVWAITDATVRRTVRGASTNRTATATVRAEWMAEPSRDDRPLARFEVNDTSDTSTAEVHYEINWQARDQGANLEWVNVTVDDGSATTTFTNRVSGETAGGIDVFTCSSSCASSHTITVTASDGTGYVATVSQDHEPDGDNGEVTAS